MKWTAAALIGLSLASALQLGAALEVDGSSGESFLSHALRLLDTGYSTHESARNAYVELTPKEDPRTAKMLRDNINKATELINDYRHNGLSNMPNLPNLPGLNFVMRWPDKLLRAELTMLQDVIRMSESMLKSPITATVNAPRDIVVMFGRMASQLEK